MFEQKSSMHVPICIIICCSTPSSFNGYVYFLKFVHLLTPPPPPYPAFDTIQRTLFINIFLTFNYPRLRGEPFVDDMAAGHGRGDLRSNNNNNNNTFSGTVPVRIDGRLHGEEVLYRGKGQRTTTKRSGRRTHNNNNTTIVISTCAIFKWSARV